jgi:hypothetical protein
MRFSLVPVFRLDSPMMHCLPSARPHFCSVTGSITHSYLVLVMYQTLHFHASALWIKQNATPKIPGWRRSATDQ